MRFPDSRTFATFAFGAPLFATPLLLPPAPLPALRIAFVPAAAPETAGASDALSPAHSAAGAASPPAMYQCPAGTLPDGDACVRLPGPDVGFGSGDFGGEDGDGANGSSGLDAQIMANMHRERSGRWATYEQIPRRPDRPADYDAYRYPVPPGLAGGKSVISGYDLDMPNELQRRGRTIRATGHGAVDLPQARGTRVELVPLEHQRGDAEVVYVGPLFGTTVVTRHFVTEAGQLREYLLLFGHLEAAGAGLSPGTHLAAGDLVGLVGDTGSPELVHLHLEARRVRAGVDVMGGLVAKLGPAGLLSNEVSIVCDPRNVLPLRELHER